MNKSEKLVHLCTSINEAAYSWKRSDSSTEGKPSISQEGMDGGEHVVVKVGLGRYQVFNSNFADDAVNFTADGYEEFRKKYDSMYGHGVLPSKSDWSILHSTSINESNYGDRVFIDGKEATDDDPTWKSIVDTFNKRWWKSWYPQKSIMIQGYYDGIEWGGALDEFNLKALFEGTVKDMGLSSRVEYRKGKNSW